jgi:hypothetical protein
VGRTVFDHLPLEAIFNLAYFTARLITLQNTEQIMHPPAPMFNPEAGRIQAFFAALCAATLWAAAHLVWWWYHRDQPTLAMRPIRRL